MRATWWWELQSQSRGRPNTGQQRPLLLPSCPLLTTASMMPAPFSTPPPPSAAPVPLPALYLYPLNDSFVPKHISLVNNQRVKIGRQTNAKTVPAERNGFFDSKVLSRQHAEVWEEGGKVRCARGCASGIISVISPHPLAARRFTSRTSSPPTALSSMVRDCRRRASSPSHSS